MKTRVVVFNKPYGVISQFSSSPPHSTLKDYITIPDVYPAGRLDTDSEGLLILTNNGKLQALISDPSHRKSKVYWVQVEGIPSSSQLDQLRKGVNLGEFTTKPAAVTVISEPTGLWLRNPPIRERKNIPVTWLELCIHEGKNRQVRRMTAKVGLPTLRLIRSAIANITLTGLLPGQWYELDYFELMKSFDDT